LAFVNACSQFIYIDALDDTDDDDGTRPDARQDPATLRQDTRLVRMLRAAIEASRGDEEWANLSAVGSQVANQATFDPRNYGYPKLSDLIGAIGLFDPKPVDKALLLRSLPPRPHKRAHPSKKHPRRSGTYPRRSGTYSARSVTYSAPSVS